MSDAKVAKPLLEKYHPSNITFVPTVPQDELKEYLDRNVIGAIRMLYLNHAVNMYPNQFTYCRKYAIKNSSRLLLSKKFTIKMKLWLLLAIFNF